MTTSHCPTAWRILTFLFMVGVLIGPASARGQVKELILPGESFLVEGRPAFVLLPPESKRAKPQPWVFYAPTLPGMPDKHETWMHQRFLEAGIAVAGIDVGEAYGSPRGKELFTAFYREMTSRRGMAARPCLLGRSRGGLWTTSWAADNPDKVAGLAGIYPVFDLRSYPGLAKAAPAYGLSARELETRLGELNPIARVNVLAKSRIPVLLIHGDEDKVVPLKENSAEFAAKYKAEGAEGAVKLIVFKGQGHNYWEGFFRCQELVDFTIARARDGAEPHALPPTNSRSLIVKRDIPYANPAHERQVLDVYAPQGAKNLPVVFWIHGGGWQAGDKKEVQLKPQTFVDKGFVFVATNYRLLPTVEIDTIFRDIAKAVRWTHEHISEHGGDPKRLLIMGHSAGAQLAALISTDDRYLKSEGLSLEIVKGCVPVDGDTYDVPAMIETAETRWRVHNLPRAKMGHREKFGNDPAKHKDFSAVTHVARGKGIPPFLILYVAGHPDVTAQAQRFGSVLKEAGVPVTLFGARETTHTRINADLGQLDDPATRALFTFVGEALKK